MSYCKHGISCRSSCARWSSRLDSCSTESQDTTTRYAKGPGPWASPILVKRWSVVCITGISISIFFIIFFRLLDHYYIMSAIVACIQCPKVNWRILVKTAVSAVSAGLWSFKKSTPLINSRNWHRHFWRLPKTNWLLRVKKVNPPRPPMNCPKWHWLFKKFFGLLFLISWSTNLLHSLYSYYYFYRNNFSNFWLHFEFNAQSR